MLNSSASGGISPPLTSVVRLMCFRNDVHHMNPQVATIPFRKLARENIKRLAFIEHEIFEGRVVTGALVPVQPKYWDIRDDGTTGVFIRCSP